MIFNFPFFISVLPLRLETAIVHNFDTAFKSSHDKADILKIANSGNFAHSGVLGSVFFLHVGVVVVFCWL